MHLEHRMAKVAESDAVTNTRAENDYSTREHHHNPDNEVKQPP
jgi:hypothetical protein